MRNFVLFSDSLVYEEDHTGILKQVNLLSNTIQPFRGICVYERKIPQNYKRVWSSEDCFFHARGGRLRKYTKCCNYLNSTEKEKRIGHFVTSKPRAILLSDTKEFNFYMCEHKGSIYVAQKHSLNKILESGDLKHIITLDTQARCMLSVPEGILIEQNSSLVLFSVNKLSLSLIFTLIFDAKQMCGTLNHLYILCTNGIMKIKNGIKTFYSIFNISCIHVYDDKLFYNVKNRVFTLKEEE